MAKDTAEKLASLKRLNRPELVALWAEVFGEPLALQAQKDFLIRALAYRLQEQAHGGLTAAARRRLRKLAADVRDGITPTLNTPRIKPGTRLIRSWRGDTHEITVLEDGFTYRGKQFRSLSEIARLITGTRWSGPLFFGLKTNGAKVPGQQHAR